MTSAQVARLAAITGDWTEPVSRGFSGSVMYDDGGIGKSEEIGQGGALLILKGSVNEKPHVVDRPVPIGTMLNRDDFAV